MNSDKDGAGPAGSGGVSRGVVAPPSALATRLLTHRCGSLDVGDVDATVRLGGWIHRRRDLGGLIFFDLRDHYGMVQIAFGPEWSEPAILELAGTLGAENVVLVEGVVRARPADARNPEIQTGDIEVHGTRLELVGPAETPPIPVWRSKGEDPPAEELRLLHRVLDLRRPEMQHNLELRHRLLQRARAALVQQGFLELETPILTKPTPEGARDFLVPSRVHPGHFYALPQSPQIYKQVLMMAGFDRYFQIARCFRDEDLRADRQPEFTQIDLEASFVAAEDVYDAVTAVAVALWDEAGARVQSPFQRLTYSDAMGRYGSDKPDLRFGYEIEDLSDLLSGRGFAAFDEGVARGDRIRGIRASGGAALSRKQTDILVEVAKANGLGGLALLKRKGDELSGPLAKLAGMSVSSAGLADGDLLLVAAARAEVASVGLGAVRLRLIELLSPAPSHAHAFAWIDDFPLFERGEDGGWTFAHHPFTAPAAADLAQFRSGDLEGVRAQHYDLVYNGHELGSGSIRISDPELQLEVFGYLGLDRGEAERRFGFLLNALRSGAPPHGGMALGFDRIAMLLAGAESLRDVIAFPKTTAARALFENTPTTVSDDDLRSLGIRLRS